LHQIVICHTWMQQGGKLRKKPVILRNKSGKNPASDSAKFTQPP
jgi:hypothetical protein